MRTLRTIQSCVDRDRGAVSVTGGEVAALCREIRRARRALATVATMSRSDAAVRAARRALHPDPLGIDDPEGALGLDGYPIRAITAFERGVEGREAHASGLTPRELAVLVVETRRLRQALNALRDRHAADCARTRRYAERVLAVNADWAGEDDAQTYPPIGNG